MTKEQTWIEFARTTEGEATRTLTGLLHGPFMQACSELDEARTPLGPTLGDCALLVLLQREMYLRSCTRALGH